MFSVLVIRLRSLRLLRVSGIVMRLRMFLLLITFLKASHSFRNRLLVRSEERFSRNAETDIVCRLLLENKNELESFVIADDARADLHEACAEAVALMAPLAVNSYMSIALTVA